MFDGKIQGALRDTVRQYFIVDLSRFLTNLFRNFTLVLVCFQAAFGVWVVGPINHKVDAGMSHGNVKSPCGVASVSGPEKECGFEFHVITGAGIDRVCSISTGAGWSGGSCAIPPGQVGSGRPACDLVRVIGDPVANCGIDTPVTHIDHHGFDIGSIQEHFRQHGGDCGCGPREV